LIHEYKKRHNFAISHRQELLPSVIDVLESCGFKSSIRVLTNRQRIAPAFWPQAQSNACNELEQQLIPKLVSRSPPLSRDKRNIFAILLYFEMYPTALRLLKLWLPV